VSNESIGELNTIVSVASEITLTYRHMNPHVYHIVHAIGTIDLFQPTMKGIISIGLVVRNYTCHPRQIYREGVIMSVCSMAWLAMALCPGQQVHTLTCCEHVTMFSMEMACGGCPS